jgi:hypothetical protein
MINGKGKRNTETRCNPTPIPLEAFENIFRNRDLVKPTTLRIIGIKKIKEIRYIMIKL